MYGLLDTSVVHRLGDVEVNDTVEERVLAGTVAVCAPVICEVSYSARNPSHLEQLREAMDAFPLVRTHQVSFDRALEVQSALARTGRHRAVSMTD